MPFVPKSWLNSPSTSTPISAAALQDLETRLSDYTDDRVDPVESTLPISLATSLPPYADVDLTGATDTTAAVQSRLDNYNHVILPQGKTIRCDTTLTIGSHRTFELAAHATVIRKTAASATTPVIRMNGANYSKLIGHGFVQTEKASPDGIIHVGPATQTVETNVQRWKIQNVTLVGGSATTTNIGINLTSSEVAGPTGAGAGSNYLGTVDNVDIQQVGVGIKEGELCNAHNFNNVTFHLIGLASYHLAGGTAGVSENSHFGGFTHAKASGNITVIKCERALFCEFYGVKAEPDAPGVPGSLYYTLDANSSQNRIIGFGNFETSGQGTDAGTFNVILDENTLQVPELVHNVPSVRAYNSGNQSIPNNAQTTLTFDSERFDPHAMHSTASNTSRLTCQRAGVYEINATVAVTASAGGTLRQLLLILNGATVIDIDREFGFTAAADTILKINTTYKLALNDYVEIAVTQDSGGALNSLANGNWSPEFSMTYQGTGT